LIEGYGGIPGRSKIDEVERRVEESKFD